MMIKIKTICVCLGACLVFLGGLAVTVTADDGSLELNEQAIYDDGHKDDAMQNYGVKTLFSPEMESQNTKQKKQANAPVVQAQKKIFMHREHSSKQIQQKNQQVLRKYLFTKRSKLKAIPGDKNVGTTEIAGFKYLWPTLLFGIMAGLGSALGIYFTKRRVKRKENSSRWTNN